jgi:hypothetical protein
VPVGLVGPATQAPLDPLTYVSIETRVELRVHVLRAEYSVGEGGGIARRRVPKLLLLMLRKAEAQIHTQLVQQLLNLSRQLVTLGHLSRMTHERTGLS